MNTPARFFSSVHDAVVLGAGLEICRFHSGRAPSFRLNCHGGRYIESVSGCSQRRTVCQIKFRKLLDGQRTCNRHCGRVQTSLYA